MAFVKIDFTKHMLGSGFARDVGAEWTMVNEDQLSTKMYLLRA
jgi:hypothetical protein